MKRIIYGSLSVLTAVCTVFVAAKAEVFNTDNKSSQLSEEIADANVSSNTSRLPGTLSDELTPQLTHELNGGNGSDESLNNGLKSSLSAGSNTPLQPNSLLGSVVGQAGVNPTLKSGQQALNALKSADGGNVAIGNPSFNRLASSNGAPGSTRPAQIVASTPTLRANAAPTASMSVIADGGPSLPASAVSVTGTSSDIQAADVMEADAVANTPASAITPSGTSLPAPGTVVPAAPALGAPTSGAPVPATGLEAAPAIEPSIDADMAEDPASLGEVPEATPALDGMPLDEMPEAGMPETEEFSEGSAEGEVFEEESFEEESFDEDASAEDSLEESDEALEGEVLEETKPDIESDAVPGTPETIPGATPFPPANGTPAPEVMPDVAPEGMPEVMPEGPEGISPVPPAQEGAPTQVVPAQPLSPTPGTNMPGIPGGPAAPEMPAAPIEPLPPTESEVVPLEEAPMEAPLEAPVDSEIESDAAPAPFPVSGSSSDRLMGEGFTPFQLSYLAISGGLKDEGIPGGGLLLSAYDAGDISAEDIVAAGASSKRLGTAASDEADFTKGVDRFLELFKRDARSSN